MSQELKDLFYRNREDFKKTSKTFRLLIKPFAKELQKMYDDWGKNKVMRQNVLNRHKDYYSRVKVLVQVAYLKKNRLKLRLSV
jgi:hypothetical protein